MLTRTSGSQRFFGRLLPAVNGPAYRGDAHYGYESEINYYGEDAEHDQVGCPGAVAAEPGRLILELPEPVFESEHEVIELVRPK